MREFSTTISDALVNGLQPDESFRDTMFFEDLYNLIPSDMTLRSYEALVDVLPIPREDRELYYPFPQWLRFENDNILVNKEDLYEVIEYDNPPFDLKYISLDFGREFSESFRYADYGNDWILLNREGCIYKYNGEIRFSDDLKASSVLKYQNRTLIGGASDGLWTDDFLRELRKVANLAELGNDEFNLDLGKNFVMWSGFDSRYLPMSLLHPEIMFNTFIDSEPFTELLYGNEFGYIEMPFKGDILDMISSNDQVFVFGEDGICSIAMSPQMSGAGFYISGQQDFGIKQRGAVGGNRDSLVFIDVFNQLWYITGEGLQKLDFSEYMKQLSGEIYITKDPEEELFYIGDKEHSFILSNGRLSRSSQTVQMASGAYPYRAAVTYETGDNKARLKSEKIDLGNTDNKTLTGIAIGIDTPVSGRAKAYAYIHGKEVSTPWVSLNQEGYAATKIHGSQHKVEIELDHEEKLSVDHIELKWQIDDRRQRRGTFTTQDSSGAG